MHSILKEIFCFLIFVSAQLIVSYGFRDPAAYQLQVHMQTQMLSEAGTDVDFMQISNYDQFWTWLDSVFIPATRADLWYSNAEPVNVSVRQPYGQRGFMDDRTGRMMGWAIMRQLRIKRDTCHREYHMRTLTNECNDVYDIMTQEEGHFGHGWQPLNGSSWVKEWRYHTAAELDGLPWIGKLALYSGGGYPFLFQGKESDMHAGVKALKDNLWLDELTRAIFLEWAIYNPNSGLFSVNTMLVEFPKATGAVSTFRFEPMDLLGKSEDGAKFIQYSSQVVFVLFLIYYLVHEIRELVEVKSAYFKDIWNWNEMVIIILSFVGIIIHFWKLFLTRDLVERFMATKGLVYIKFQIASQWHELLMYVVGLVVFFTNLKFIRLLRFNRHISMLGTTLAKSARDLGNFSILFGVVFFAYVQLFYLLNCNYLIGYKTLIASAQTNLNIMLGKFNFQGLMSAHPVLAPIFFFLYVITMVMVVMNMFISILCETFSQVRIDLHKQGNDYEMVEFIFRRFKTFIGLSGRPDDADLNNAKPIDGVSAPYEQIDNLPLKIDQLMKSITNLYDDNDEIDFFLDPSKLGGNKEMYKNVMKNDQANDENKSNLPDIE